MNLAAQKERRVVPDSYGREQVRLPDGGAGVPVLLLSARGKGRREKRKKEGIWYSLHGKKGKGLSGSRREQNFEGEPVTLVLHDPEGEKKGKKKRGKSCWCTC